MAKLTDDQVEAIKKDFLEWSGGFPPGTDTRARGVGTISTYMTHSVPTDVVSTPELSRSCRKMLKEWAEKEQALRAMTCRAVNADPGYVPGDPDVDVPCSILSKFEDLLKAWKGGFAKYYKYASWDDMLAEEPDMDTDTTGRSVLPTEFYVLEAGAWEDMRHFDVSDGVPAGLDTAAFAEWHTAVLQSFCKKKSLTTIKAP